jgi:uncharacterized protein (TIGR04255 family)
MVHREVFPNPPLRLVSFELRFPIRRRVATRPVWDAFEEVFAGDLPDVKLLVREDDDSQLPTNPNEPVLRRTNAERNRVVTLRYGALTVETTEYVSYDKFRGCINAAIEALSVVPSASNITRLGLRYINEVRVPGIEGKISDWKPYVNHNLLATTGQPPPGLHSSWVQGGLGFHSTEGAELIYLAFGPLPHSSVEPDGVLQLSDLSGPCFLLDIDSFVSGSPRKPVATTRKEVLGVVDRLHESVETVFNWCITEKLRKDVLRVASAKGGKPPSDLSEVSRV